MRIIPAIDIINAQCVRLSQGDYAKKTIYNQSPLEVAKQFEANGIKYLHLVDLDGAKAHGVVNLKVLEAIATQTDLQIDFGGGIKSEEDVKAVFNAGARQITVGSIAISNPEIVKRWITTYGKEQIILGADCKNQMIATQGWTNTSSTTIFDLIESYRVLGLDRVICTDIAKDGMLNGPSVALYASLLERFNIKLIASGGVRSIEDLTQLKQMGCEAAIIGKALYENKITLKQLETLC
ncbi:MAG: 1-(5-phosphoribosyl)-5-[(5-phosphoribosylamino)methylideneamino]imidazole-4-carboxamide isomerase [Gilvibacter sp.]